MLRAVKTAVSRMLPDRIHPRTLAHKRVLTRSGGKVIAGPFRGMTYVTSADDFVEGAMLMGTYEKELHPVIEAWLSAPGDVFIDVGAAQGYYSVGMARRAPHARHIGFEMDQERIRQLERTAAANSVKVELWGQCEPPRLVDALNAGKSPCLIMDVEGYEDVLLRGEVLEALKGTRMVIETHDYFVPGITEDVRRRLEPTHSVQLVEMGKRTAADLPFRFADRWTLEQVDEGRDGQTWLVANPRVN